MSQPKIILDIIRTNKKALEIFRSSEIAEKRQLLQFLLQNPILDGKNLVFTLKTPFDRVLEANKCSEMLPGQGSSSSFGLAQNFVRTCRGTPFG